MEWHTLNEEPPLHGGFKGQKGFHSTCRGSSGEPSGHREPREQQLRGESDEPAVTKGLRRAKPVQMTSVGNYKEMPPDSQSKTSASGMSNTRVDE